EEVATLDAIERMRREAYGHQRVAALAGEGRQLALPLEPDHLAVLDISRQLDGQLAAVGELRGHLGGVHDVLDRHLHGRLEVGRGRHAACTAAAARAARLPAEDVGEDVARIEALGAELEAATALVA